MKEEATFAAGCFWGVEAAFRKRKGVLSTSAGYTGGKTRNPDYGKVCGGKTGHAEAVRVGFDPTGVSYKELLDLFWKIHDPTQRGGQGPDTGSQYGSVIFYHNEKQRKTAEASRKAIEKRLRKKVSTSIEPAGEYYMAEEYHQNYYGKPLLGRLRGVCRL